jgi:peptidyl-prolyl cis-trans isomerase D
MHRSSLRSGLLGVALAASALTGCSNFRDLFSAHADTAAEAAGMELSSERLAQIMAGARSRQRLTRETAEFVASTWVEYALLSQAVARNQLPTDSASVAEAVWPELSELKGSHFHDSLVARRSAVSDSATDSLYGAAGPRLFQHILFGLRPNATPETKSATRKKAEGTLTRLRGGANFGVLASQLSEDPGSKADSGYLPPSPRGRFVPAFDSAGWSLAPGQMSGLVETPFGYHIIRRPALSDVRGRLGRYLTERASVRLDSMYMDSLAGAYKVEVLDDAPRSMREAWESPDESRRSDKALVRFTGGELTVREYLRWVRALPPQYSAQLRQANDTVLGQFAKVLAQNVLLLREADSAGIRITADEWSDLQARYLSQLDTLKREMHLDVPELSDSTTPVDMRQRIAALKVEQYFDSLVAGKIRLRPIPSALAILLREKFPYRVNDAGLNRSVELAQQLRSQDTMQVERPGDLLKRAPGPAPVPGAAPAPTDTAATRPKGDSAK